MCMTTCWLSFKFKSRASAPNNNASHSGLFVNVVLFVRIAFLPSGVFTLTEQIFIRVISSQSVSQLVSLLAERSNALWIYLWWVPFFPDKEPTFKSLQTPKWLGGRDVPTWENMGHLGQDGGGADTWITYPSAVDHCAPWRPILILHQAASDCVTLRLGFIFHRLCRNDDDDGPNRSEKQLKTTIPGSEANHLFVNRVNLFKGGSLIWN